MSLENKYDSVSEYLLSYLPEVFGHFNFLTILILKIE